MTKLSLIVVAGLGFTILALSPPVMAQPGPLLSINVSAVGKLVANRLVRTDETVVHFCGENVPTRHPAIVERWNQMLHHQAAMAPRLAKLKRRASVIFPLIEPILEQYQIPSDFKFLPLLESAFSNRAVSRKGAGGFWQLMPQTAHTLGLDVSTKRDERFDLVKSTHAACRYIVELHDLLGSWMLVATAYNAGPNYIQQLVRQHPDMHPMALPYRAPETRSYLFQAVAVKELFTHPELYRDQLSSENIIALTDGAQPVEIAERAAILASFDMTDALVKQLTDQKPVTVGVPFIADSTTTVVLLDEPKSVTGVSPRGAVAMSANGPGAQVVSITETAPVVTRLKTRSISEGPLTEGKLCLFQVIQPVSLNGRAFAVGDLIYAFIDVIDTRSGRVYLRTERLTKSQTQESFSLKLTATEQASQPGVTLPAHLENWQLSWEAL